MENNSFLCVSCHDNDTAAVTLSDEGQLHLFQLQVGKITQIRKALSLSQKSCHSLYS